MNTQHTQITDTERVLLGWPSCEAVILGEGRWSHPTTDIAGKELCGKWLELDIEHDEWLAATALRRQEAVKDPGRGRCGEGHSYGLLRRESDILRRVVLEAAEAGEPEV